MPLDRDDAQSGRRSVESSLGLEALLPVLVGVFGFWPLGRPEPVDHVIRQIIAADEGRRSLVPVQHQNRVPFAVEPEAMREFVGIGAQAQKAQVPLSHYLAQPVLFLESVEEGVDLGPGGENVLEPETAEVLDIAVEDEGVASRQVIAAEDREEGLLRDRELVLLAAVAHPKVRDDDVAGLVP